MGEGEQCGGSGGEGGDGARTRGRGGVQGRLEQRPNAPLQKAARGGARRERVTRSAAGDVPGRGAPRVQLADARTREHTLPGWIGSFGRRRARPRARGCARITGTRPRTPMSAAGRSRSKAPHTPRSPQPRRSPSRRRQARWTPPWLQRARASQYARRRREQSQKKHTLPLSPHRGSARRLREHAATSRLQRQHRQPARHRSLCVGALRCAQRGVEGTGPSASTNTRGALLFALLAVRTVLQPKRRSLLL